LRKSVKYFYDFTAFTACRKVYAIFRGQDLSRKTVKVRCLRERQTSGQLDTVIEEEGEKEKIYK
jgi:hypothetical protein